MGYGSEFSLGERDAVEDVVLTDDELVGRKRDGSQDGFEHQRSPTDDVGAPRVHEGQSPALGDGHANQ